MQIAILGAGMVGRAMALDLVKQHNVTSFDISDTNLQFLNNSNSKMQTVQTDLTNYENYSALLKPFDYVISAVPGFMGYKTLEAIIKCGKNVVDISFFPEDALQLDSLAKEKNVTAITDCGVAPGMSNLIAGYYNELLTIKSFECFVGGLPKQRVKPFEYKAPFSPADVLEEYTRPARYVENGAIVVKPALSDAELIDFEKAGTLEAFNTDGLRSLIHTLPHIPDMKEKTLRYPGHIDFMKALFKAGFFNREEMNYKGQMISPLQFSTAILFEQWKLQPNEEEFTLMQINIKAKEKNIQAFLYDEFDKASQTSSMSRTTGYTCTAALNMLIENLFMEKGVFPPELVGKHRKCYNYILHYLKDRDVHYRFTEN